MPKMLAKKCTDCKKVIRIRKTKWKHFKIDWRDLMGGPKKGFLVRCNPCGDVYDEAKYNGQAERRDAYDR
jgi:hypothetical protein